MKKRLLIFLLLLNIILLGAGCEDVPQASQVYQQPAKPAEQINTQPQPNVQKPATTQSVPQEQAAPNGTYTNTYGNEVPSPYYAPTVPAGATARCRDGTYSFSQNRSGTCSHHGGVAQWL